MPLAPLDAFRGLPLPGGFVLTGIALVEGRMLDPIGRPALARTTIQGRELSIALDAAQSADELSISIYHELLEGLTVAFPQPPLSVLELTEAGFERAAHEAHARFGVATPASVLAFLASFGFR
jgi:hypothetical protein